jgi:hypothetical protein
MAVMTINEKLEGPAAVFRSLRRDEDKCTELAGGTAFEGLLHLLSH